MNPIEPDRLIPLSTGTPGIRSTIHVEITKPPPAHETHSLSATGGEGQGEVVRASDPSTLNSNHPQPTLDFASSDETLDRYNEIIVASGWQLANYHQNPVFQNSHQYGDIIFTLGKATITEVRGSTLFQRIQFATEANPIAKIAYGLYRGKFLNAVSVGFAPLRWENGTEKTAYRRKYLEQELLEVSAVGIPANPNALALGVKSGAIEKSDLRDTLEVLRLTLERTSGGADSLSAACGGEGQGEVVCSLRRSHLLHFFRNVNSLLRK